MKHLLLCIALVALGSSAFAEDDFAEEYTRQETLELPGVSAGCHICEWRPKLNQKPAPEQCGVDDTGQPLVGLFECGFSEDCERVCHFLGCGEG